MAQTMEYSFDSKAMMRPPQNGAARTLAMSSLVDAARTLNVISASGRAWSRTLTSVMTPSVPHEPVSRRVRSKPATFFTTRPPPRTVAPRPLMNSTPSVRSRGAPKRVASGPADAVAIVAPMVPSSEPNGSSASHCPCGATAS